MSVVDREIEREVLKQRKKKTRILVALVVLLLAIVAAILFFLFYKKPISNIVSTKPVPPTYMTSIYADFNWPIGIATSPDGDQIYVVDSNNRLVRVFNRSGKQIRTFGQDNTKEKNKVFSNPLYIAVDPSGKVYVSDRSTATISIFTAEGKFIRYFTPKAGLDFTWSPLAIAFDKNGDLYVTDATQGKHRVFRFNRNGYLKSQFGREGQSNGDFSFPNGIAISEDGKIFVADSNNSRMQAFDKNGKFLFVVGKKSGKSQLGRPLGLAISGNDRVHVSDTFGHSVQVFDTKGKYLYGFGSFGVKEGQFMFPTGIAINGNRVYVVDRENKRVQIWEY